MNHLIGYEVKAAYLKWEYYMNTTNATFGNHNTEHDLVSNLHISQLDPI